MIIIISDLHLVEKFDKYKFETIRDIITPADQVIINGDLWISKRVSFEKFFHSEWSQLFPLFKERNTVYIHGNHDDVDSMDERMNEYFPKIVKNYSFTLGKFTYYLEHGHDRFWKIPLNLMESAFIQTEILDKLEYNLTLKHGYPNSFTGRLFQKRYKKYAHGTYSDNEYLIIGHTHQPEVDPVNHFINCGFFDYGKAYYLKITEEGPELVAESYKDIRSDFYED